MINLENACLQLVAFKDHLDALLLHGERAGDALPLTWQRKSMRLRGHARDYVGAIAPHTFVRSVLPLASSQSDLSEPVQDVLDPRLIVAGTYNSYDPHAFLSSGNISPDFVMNRSDEIVLESNGKPYAHPETPIVGKLGELPLYFSIEGKNRVSLFKRFRTRMHVYIQPCFFPQPDELRLVPLSPFGQIGLESFGQLQVLPFPTIATPVLKAYGVQETKRRMWFGASKAARIRRQIVVNDQMVR